MWHWIDIWNAFHMVQCVSFANQPLHEVIHPESESGLLRIPPGPEGWWFGTPAISKLHLKMPRIQKWYIVVTYHTSIYVYYQSITLNGLFFEHISSFMFHPTLRSSFAASVQTQPQQADLYSTKLSTPNIGWTEVYIYIYIHIYTFSYIYSIYIYNYQLVILIHQKKMELGAILMQKDRQRRRDMAKKNP